MILGLFLAIGCAHGGALPAARLTVGAEKITVEVADEPQERSLGLMYRDSLDADTGMLFVYPDEAERSFWMRNTRVPLSIAYIDAKGRIVHIADLAPLDERSVPSLAPAKYALEMNKGWFAAHGVQVGSTVTGLPP